jgi:hypothetical protein
MAATGVSFADQTEAPEGKRERKKRFQPAKAKPGTARDCAMKSHRSGKLGEKTGVQCNCLVADLSTNFRTKTVVPLFGCSELALSAF